MLRNGNMFELDTTNTGLTPNVVVLRRNAKTEGASWGSRFDSERDRNTGNELQSQFFERASQGTRAQLKKGNQGNDGNVKGKWDFNPTQRDKMYSLIDLGAAVRQLRGVQDTLGSAGTERQCRVGLRQQKSEKRGFRMASNTTKMGPTHGRAWRLGTLKVHAVLASGGETSEEKGVKMTAHRRKIPARGISKHRGIAYAAATRWLAGRRHPVIWRGVGLRQQKILKKWSHITSKSKSKCGRTRDFSTARGILIHRVIASAAAPRQLAGARDTPTFKWIRCFEVVAGCWPLAAKILKKKWFRKPANQTE
ncbi:hypothetical protein C8R43DRAFT_959978 [Mycena crocata]|nr:hypothetical protein C8R43DRAFT_959978 [Mycena crocata]